MFSCYLRFKIAPIEDSKGNSIVGKLLNYIARKLCNFLAINF